MGMSATLKEAGVVRASIIADIDTITPGSTELDNEGRARGLRTPTHTVRARDICPDQNHRAARGFRQLIFGR